MARPPSKKPTLREALLAKLGYPDRRRLHALANGVRKRLGQMSRADAYAVLADEQGIKLHKYLVEPDLGCVRGIIAAGRVAAPAPGNGSVREVVRRVMEKRHGTDWFKQPMVPRKVLDHVETNKKNEATVPWHAARGGHDIHYTTIDDLLAIMFATNDNKPVFEAVLGKETGVRHLVEIIETARHTVAHHRPLAPDDFKRLQLNVRAWQKLMRERKHLIE